MPDVQYRCPVETTLKIVGGKWKPSILYSLHQGTQRFGELKQLLPDVTQRMLTLHLRELERDMLIHRTAYMEVPPKVEYSLTEFGSSLVPILLLMRDWGEQYIREVDIAP
jgi:DNA-binding HxlR family transcriptional regulator